MSFDCSRFSFHPWNDFFGVVMQQGRRSARFRLERMGGRALPPPPGRDHGHAGPRASCPAPRPRASTSWRPAASSASAAGRIYVDGILAENHGAGRRSQWDPALAELEGDHGALLLRPALSALQRHQSAGTRRYLQPPRADGRAASRLSRCLAAGSDALAVSRSGREGRRRRYHRRGCRPSGR